MTPKINGIYKHYKGDLYIVQDIATHSETREPLVIYRALHGDSHLYARPLEMWSDEINKNNQKLRFELQDIKSVRD